MIKAQLPPTLRLLIYFGIMVSLVGSGLVSGWYAHKFYGVSNELAVNKDDAIRASEINEQQTKDLKFVDDWKESIIVNNPCGNLSFDELYQINKQRQ